MMRSRSIGALIAAVIGYGAVVVVGQAQAPTQAPAPAAQTGPGVQSPSDSKFAAYVAANCKNPPPGRAGGPRPAAPAPMHRAYTVAAIPGVIAAGQTWKTVWTGTGNNADGPLATPDGGMLFAQNTDSKVMKIDRNGAVSFPYTDTNTGGALAMNKKGELFIVQRGLPQEIWQLAPTRRLLANRYMGEPLDCAGLLNDITADSKGGVYFTKGGVHYADAKGVVTKYGTVGGNGIILSPDEKTLYVTGRLASAAGGQAPAAAPAAGAPGAGAAGGRGGGPTGGLVAFDVQPDGSLTNERQFALVGGDGSAVDEQGRVYSTGGGGVQVVDKDGTFLGEIPSPLPLITAAFGGPDKKTLYGVANNQQFVEIFTIPMLAEGYRGRAK